MNIRPKISLLGPVPMPFLFITRGHVQDLGMPIWIATENTESFFSDVLNIEA